MSASAPTDDARGDQRLAGLDIARDLLIVQGARCLQRDARGVRRLLVTVLDRRLRGAQLLAVHEISRLSGNQVERVQDLFLERLELRGRALARPVFP